jgi:hypothetical protein
VRECNELTVYYGLYLSEEQMREVAGRRFEALRNTGRVEFGGGILKKLLTAFRDSPYLTRENYEDAILELQDSFYYFKNESMDRIGDDELIAFMKEKFDGVCQGRWKPFRAPLWKTCAATPGTDIIPTARACSEENLWTNHLIWPRCCKACLRSPSPGTRRGWYGRNSMNF